MSSKKTAGIPAPASAPSNANANGTPAKPSAFSDQPTAATSSAKPTTKSYAAAVKRTTPVPASSPVPAPSSLSATPIASLPVPVAVAPVSAATVAPVPAVVDKPVVENKAASVPVPAAANYQVADGDDDDAAEEDAPFIPESKSDGHLLTSGSVSNFGQTQEEQTAFLYNRLFTNNRTWVKKQTDKDPEFFNRLAKGQSPHYLLIGCSDSRVPPDQLTQTRPGEIFIHRNVANLVVNTDMNLMAVLQYAVEVLKVKHVIVMGHYECGGVKAALTCAPYGLINKWLRNIKDVIRLHQDELSHLNEDQQFRRLVELNVQEQVFNIIKTSIVQAAWNIGQPLQVHGWVCDVKTGLITDLRVEESDDWKSIASIYTLNFKPDENKKFVKIGLRNQFVPKPNDPCAENHDH